VTPSPHFAVALLVFVLGGNALLLAHKVFWHRHRRIYWYTAGAIVIGIGGLIVTGAAEIVAPWIWPVPLDPAEADKFRRQVDCDMPRAFGTALVFMPIVLLLASAWLRTFDGRPVMSYLAILLFGVCCSLFYISPVSEKLARTVFSEETLKVPSHCMEAGP
jgi:hypothetical protein